MTHVVTLVAWLSHSMYVCVLVFSFRWAHMSQLLTSPRLGFATVLGGGGGICYYFWVVVHLHEVHTPLQQSTCRLLLSGLAGHSLGF